MAKWIACMALCALMLFGARTAQPAPAAEIPVPRRERRTSPNTVEWNAARNGQLEGYNPYTGTMPAAAGDYERFGGYGY